MSEVVPNSPNEDEANLFLNLEKEDYGPLHEQETALADARNALMVHLDEIMQGRGGESLHEASEILGDLMNAACRQFFTLSEFALDYFDYDEFIVYWQNKLLEDEAIRTEMILTIVDMQNREEELNITRTPPSTAKKLAHTYANAMLQSSEEPEAENEYNRYTPAAQIATDFGINNEQIIDGVKSYYQRALVDGFNEIQNRIPPNLNDMAKQEAWQQEQVEDYHESHRREMVANFLFHVASSAIGTGLVVGANHLFKKFKR